MKHTLRFLLLILFVLVCLPAYLPAATMSTYSWSPPVVSDASEPNTILLMSNDWTGFTRGYKDNINYDDDREYWGYFDPDKYYEYASPKGPFRPVGYNDFGTHYVPASAGSGYWSGNFLNWVTMSNADFLRKALTGGRRSADSIGNVEVQRALIASGEAWKKTYSGSDLGRLVPAAYNNSNYEFFNVDRTMTVRNKSNGSTVGGPFTVEVLVCETGMLEDNCQMYPSVGDAKPQGLLHEYADKINFALFTYTHPGTTDDQGGVLRTPMKKVTDEWSSNNGQENSGISGMIRYINNYTRKGWDALAEMYYDALRYYKGNTGASAAYCDGTGMQSDDGYPVFGCKANKPWPDDPIVNWCQKNNIILLNDEYPSQEHNAIPGSPYNPGYTVTTHVANGNDRPYNIDVGYWTDVVGDWEKAHGTTSNQWYVGQYPGYADGRCDYSKFNFIEDLALANGICPTEPGSGSKGTFFLAGLAHHAFIHDLRSDFDEKQNVATWSLAFRATSNATYNPPDPPMNQMWLAAKYGNFDDINGNGKPDAGEWEDPSRTDKNGNPLPYAYYSAEDGAQLVEAFGNIFDAILETTASGTAVSVLANSGQGEGNLVQAYYRPRISEGNVAVDWVGFLQSLWIDEYGYIREDTVSDNILNHTQDKVVRYVETSGTTVAWIYDVSATNPYPDFATDPYTEVALEEVKVLWDAGKVLSTTDPRDRKIFTFLDRDQDGEVDSSDTDMFDDSGEVIQFYDRNYRHLMPYLNVSDNITDAYLGRSQKIRALNLVRWMRGYDPEVNSNRFVDNNNVNARTRSLNGVDVYKLGDVVNSTPVTIAQPPDGYHIIYSDKSYQAYFDKYKDRETVVYVGGNDGMMHAFTAWRFNKNLSQFVDPDPLTTEPIGSELWAYIPQNLLPHLKWQARTDYSHVYYVDLQPRIFDARIFTSEFNDPTGKHPYGWGTILVGGYGIGGGQIDVTDRFDDGTGSVSVQSRSFKPSYFAIDITDPRDPQLLWDKAYEGLGMSYVFPTVMRLDHPTQPVSPKEDNVGKWYLLFGSGPDDGSRVTPTPQYDGDSESPGYFYAVDVLTGNPYQSTDASSITHDYLFETTEDFAFMGPPVSFDKNLNFNVDAVYVPVTYDNDTTASHDWQGSIYKVTIPWHGALSTAVDKASYGTTSARYSSDPYDTSNGGSMPWTFDKLFDSPRPITAAPSLSIDQFNNTWVYFGTGRLFEGDDSDDSDFKSGETEYLFGVKDPFFNRDYAPSTPSDAIPDYYLDYSLNKTVTYDPTDSTNDPTDDLFYADPYIILDTGIVYEDTGLAAPVYYGYFDEMVAEARTYDGWVRSLRQEDELVDGKTVTRSMRNLNKPSVIGGLSLFSTFMPTGNTCSFGGESDLNILYYETGTAFKRSVARGAGGLQSVGDITGDSEADMKVKDAISLGSGTTSSVGIHIGRQNQRSSASGDDPEGDMVTGFVQQGTGTVVEIDIETAIKIRSGLRAWREK